MRRLAALVLAAVVGLSGVLVLPARPAGAAEGDASEVSITRYGGADRYSTSLLIAEAVAADAGGSLEWVVLVSGERWTDAVVAASVAGALGAPVLMTPPGELRADAVEFLSRVGATDAVVIGPETGGGSHGPGRGVSATVLDALAQAGVSTDRVAGSDRYSTGVAAAGRVTPGVMPGLGRTAIVASGEVFADALVAGPFAARGTHPVLLSPPDELHADVAGYLTTAGIEHVVVMGGTAALSTPVETAIGDLGVSVTRLSGTTRYDTAVRAAKLVTDRYSTVAGQTCFAAGTIGVARARVPFDSFSAAPLLARQCAPLVLADPKQIPTATAAYLDAARSADDTVDLRVFGGNAAVSQAAIDAYLIGEDPKAGESEAGEGNGDSEIAEEAATDNAADLPTGTCGGSIDDEPRRLTSSDNSEDPAWSPDCSRLVFSRGGSLWTMGNDGDDQQQLTRHDNSYSDEPTWSPDGTKIAYTRGQRNDDGHWFSHIYVVSTDGSDRTKVSKGDVRDERPSWSPDGTRLVFERLAGSERNDDGSFIDGDRHIVVMDVTGENRTALTAGGRWEQSPAWSPDGTRIAYIADDSVWLIDADGSHPERVIAGAYWNGDVSWSPDGRRVAFVRGDGDESAIVAVGIDGTEETVVADLSGADVSPRWSPDGQLIAFTNYEADSERDAYVAGARGTPAAADCRPRGLDNTTAGFPLPAWAAPSTGTVRVAVLFMDFPDAQATHSAQVEAGRGLPDLEAYLESVSYGKLDVQLVPHLTWLRAVEPHTHYISDQAFGAGIGRRASEHAVDLADPEFDFSDIHAVMVVFPGTHFLKFGNAGGSVSADGATMRVSRIHTRLRDVSHDQPDWVRRANSQWGILAAHELAHNLGLLDLYPYDTGVHARPAAGSGKEWIPVRFGLMELNGYFQADESAMLRRITVNYADGASYWFISAGLEVGEMLAWSRWQLGWLSDSQISCITQTDATVALAAIAQPDGHVAMAAVPLSNRRVIVVESRRNLGYDVGRPLTWPRGDTANRRALLHEGVLVYTVDALVASGRLPMRIAGDSGDGQVDGFPVLTVGESVTVEGYTITVTGDDGDTHTVSITRSG